MPEYTGENHRLETDERRQSVRRSAYTFQISLIGLLIVIAGLIYAGSGRAIKAEQAWNFATAQAELPGKVAAIQKIIDSKLEIEKDYMQLRSELPMRINVLERQIASEYNGSIPIRVVQLEKRFQDLDPVPVERVVRLEKKIEKLDGVPVSLARIEGQFNSIKIKIDAIFESFKDQKKKIDRMQRYIDQN